MNHCKVFELHESKSKYVSASVFVFAFALRSSVPTLVTAMILRANLYMTVVM